MVVVKPSCLCPEAGPGLLRATLRRHVCLEPTGDRQRKGADRELAAEGRGTSDGGASGEAGADEGPG